MGDTAPGRIARHFHLAERGAGVTAAIFAGNTEFRLCLQKPWAARVLDMESAAVMQIADSNLVPAIVVRSLSDLAGADRDRTMEATFAHLAPVNCAQVVRAFGAALPD